ncbi:MAG TPA: 50S ribosomal protein L13 [Clostridiales bacterium]|nr:50S ribosomal protein L13 [Clostridiales bacterium]
MKSYMEKKEAVSRNWYVIDAKGLPLGRLASSVASILRGKNKPTFTPHVDGGDFVIVVNCADVLLTGKKVEQKEYVYHTGYPGGRKAIPYSKLMKTDPEFVVKKAVKGMLPKTTLGRKMIKRLFVYAGPEHKQEAQKPQVLTLDI